ncbi:MAG TPA: adenylyl-sulfate kinase [Coleofasciculaceae cyanobacterium]
MMTSVQVLNDTRLIRTLEAAAHQEQKCGVTIWLTGLSGGGKTTISKFLEQELRSQGYKVTLLDGDVIRQNLTKGLGFSKEDRDENIRRIGFVADLLTQHGAVTIVSAISPYRNLREEIRQRIGNFIEVYVNAPLDVCEQRDVKGLYKRARAGQIKQFTGIDDPYEPPLAPEVECRTDRESVAESASKILAKLRELDYVRPQTNSINTPFHLSICVSSLELTRNFYKNIIGVSERRATKSSVHFDFYGCQLTCHEVPGFTADILQREVDAEDVPVPHFGAALTLEEFSNLKDRLIHQNITFVRKPSLRFIGKPHEQYVMFLKDPSGYGIEIKSFTKAPVGNWA